MGNRLSKIYTRGGDDGSTGMATGARVRKDAPIIEAIGELDELNCCLGLLLCLDLPPALGDWLQQQQHRLFDIGGALSLAGSEFATAPVQPGDIEALERQMDAWNEHLPPLKEFILPGGGEAAATCHLARAVCRRAERRVLGLPALTDVRLHYVLPYINRLSDALFVAARMLNRHAGHTETLWRSRKMAE